MARQGPAARPVNASDDLPRQQGLGRQWATLWSLLVAGAEKAALLKRGQRGGGAAGAAARSWQDFAQGGYCRTVGVYPLLQELGPDSGPEIWVADVSDFCLRSSVNRCSFSKRVRRSKFHGLVFAVSLVCLRRQQLSKPDMRDFAKRQCRRKAGGSHGLAPRFAPSGGTAVWGFARRQSV